MHEDSRHQPQPSPKCTQALFGRFGCVWQFGWVWLASALLGIGIGVLFSFSFWGSLFQGKWGLGVAFDGDWGLGGALGDHLSRPFCVCHEKRERDPIGNLHMLLRVTCFKVCVFSIGSCLCFSRNWVLQKSVVPFDGIGLGSILGAFWAPKSSKFRCFC